MESGRSGARRLMEEAKPRKDLQLSEEAAIRMTSAAETFIRLASREAWLVISWNSSAVHANGAGKKRLQEEHVVQGLRKMLTDPQSMARLRAELGIESQRAA